jgi:hypothetical protein
MEERSNKKMVPGTVSTVYQGIGVFFCALQNTPHFLEEKLTTNLANHHEHKGKS